MKAMQIVFDNVEWTGAVSSRDEVITLDAFADQKTGILAGEEYCGERGCNDREPGPRIGRQVRSEVSANPPD